MNMPHPLFYARFPESLKEIREAIGLENTLKLVTNCGGTRIFVPKRISAQHRLANLLGLKAARQLSRRFGGESLTVVRGAPALRNLRNREIVAKYNNGVRVADLARSYALTERRIYSILAGTSSN
ncbi:MAG: DNA transposition protein [Magnetococcales bacterium]|nr:DNA transposition protein [Magnetococcales bacterium]